MDATNFIKDESPRLLAQLQPETQPLWGMMTAHHMIEHLSALFYIAQKDLGLPLVTPPEKLERAKRFLWNDRPMKRHVANVSLKPGELAKLRTQSLDEAKALYQKSMDRYYAHYASHPEDQHMHPVFGMLKFDEWEAFHKKHIEHHFRQFGLVPLPVEE